jgi:hypothetical protein
VMTTCLKYCTPIAAVMFLGASVWTYKFPGGLWLRPSQPYGTVREGIVTSAEAERAAKASATSPSPLTGEGRGEGASSAAMETIPSRKEIVSVTTGSEGYDLNRFTPHPSPLPQGEGAAAKEAN